MNLKYYQNAFLLCCLFALFSLLSSCKTPQNPIYFSDLDSLKIKELKLAEFKEPIIQTDDILDISVQTMGQNAFAAPTSTSDAGGAKQVTANVSSFLVNKAGEIEMPMMGIIKVSGLTTTQAVDLIRQNAEKFFKVPTVQVRFSNFKITVLGEVTRPSTYIVPYERVSVLDAISLAGDLTFTGKRSNILLMRNNGDTKEVVRLNLNSSKLIESPYFYLKQNDVLIVEPTNVKIRNANAPNTVFFTLGLSLITLIVTILR